MLIPNVEKQHKHDKTSEDLDVEIQEFLANGGKIQQIETGLSGEDLRAVPCNRGEGYDGSRYKYVKTRKLQLTIKRGG